jgi:hypothetical protein
MMVAGRQRGIREVEPLLTLEIEHRHGIQEVGHLRVMTFGMQEAKRLHGLFPTMMIFQAQVKVMLCK